MSPFAKEIYKNVRNAAKKLEDIERIEERKREKGFKMTEEQAEKLAKKDEYLSIVQKSLEVFDVYRKTELTNLIAA